MELTKEYKAEQAIQSLSDSCGLFAALSGGYRRGEGCEVWLAPGTFWYNRVRLSPQPAAQVNAALSAITAGIRAGENPPLLGWLDSDFPGLAEKAAAAGFVPITTQAAMFLSLAGRVPAAAVPREIEALDPAEVQTWALKCARAFGKPPEPDGMTLLAEKGGPERTFLLWREAGEIAAGTLLCCVDGNAGIHEVFTLPEYRGRGIASALVSHALDLGAGQGCDRATLQASPLGAPVYRALGFEEVGTVQNWIYQPEYVKNALTTAPI